MGAGVLAAILVILSGQTPRIASSKTAGDEPEARLEIDASIDFYKSESARWWQVMPSATYTVNPRWSVEVGLPVYWVNGELTDDGVAHAGVGDMYVSVSLDASNDSVTFYSTLSGAAPTGSYAKGLGAGTATFDWKNHVEIERGRLAPYVEGGFGNSLSTAFRGASGPSGSAGRPVVSVGKFFQAEAGLQLDLGRSWSSSLSAYVVRPLGAAGTGPRPPGRPGGTSGSFAAGDLDRDHGVAATLAGTLTSSLDVSVWFWRSLRFRYNTVSASVNINLSALLAGTKAADAKAIRR
jgi:hypothetical protein